MLQRVGVQNARAGRSGGCVLLHNVSYASNTKCHHLLRSGPRSIYSGICLLLFLLLPLSSFPSLSDAAPPAPAPVWGYLDNGMGYVLLETHAAPLIGSSVIVHSGSAREDFATSGASHFLEHLLFNGTETRSQQQLYDDVDAIGGYNNATTRRTHVVYMMVTPAENFRQGLEIQRDMLFHSTLPTEKVEKERGIILEEMARDRDGGTFDSDRMLDLMAFGPSGAGLPTLGSESSIRTMSRETILAFYNALYTPQNMTLVVLGDFGSRDMEKMIHEVLGAEPAGPPPPPLSVSEPIWDPSPVVAEMGGESTCLEWTWPGPDPRMGGFTAFECASQLLSGEDSGRLNRLVRERFPGKIRSCGGRFETFPDRSYFRYRVEADPVVDWQAIQSALPELIEKARVVPDLADIRAWSVSEMGQEFFLREKPHYYAVLEGDRIASRGVEGILRRPDELEALSPADLSVSLTRWANGPYRLGVILPRTRDVADSTGPGGALSLRSKLPNGLDLLVLSSPESPVLALHLFVRGRSQAEPPGLDGAVELLHRLLPVRTTNSTPEELARRIRSIGAELTTADNPDIPYDDFYSVPDYSFIKLQSLDRYEQEAFGLLAEILTTPAWTDQDFEESRQSMLSCAERSASGTSAAVRNVIRNTFWEGCSRSRQIFGSPTTLRGMQPQALRELADSYFVGSRMLLVVATSKPPDEIIRTANATLGRLRAGTPAPPRDSRGGVEQKLRVALQRADAMPPELGTVPLPDSTVVRIAKIGGKQASVIVVRSLGHVESLDRARADVWNAVLSSKIQFQLREQDGLAYSIGSSVDRLDDGTLLWTASAGTGAKNIARILRGLNDQLEVALATAPSSDEVHKNGAQLYGSALRRRASRMNRAYAAGLAIIEERDPARIDEEIRAPMEVSVDGVQSLLSQIRLGTGMVVIAY
jgi:zinc protease